MKSCVFSITLLLWLPGQMPAQQYSTRTAWVVFRSETPLLTIEANNYFGAFRLDGSTGQVVCEVPVQSFEFDKRLMKSHFNKYFMESEKFPNATFQGWIDSIGAVNFRKDGDYPIVATGNMTIRGVTQTVKARGRIQVAKQLPTLYGTFEVALADFGIPFPEFVRKKVSDKVKLSVVARCRTNAND